MQAIVQSLASRNSNVVSFKFWISSKTDYFQNKILKNRSLLLRGGFRFPSSLTVIQVMFFLVVKLLPYVKDLNFSYPDVTDLS